MRATAVAAGNASTSLGEVRAHLIPTKRVLGRLSHEFLKEQVCLAGMLLAPCQCNSQGKDLRVLEVAFRELKKKTGCLGKIIECESSFNGGKFRSKPLRFGFLAKDGGACSFWEPFRGVFHLLEVNAFISFPDSNIPVQGEDENDPEDKQGEIKNERSPEKASHLTEDFTGKSWKEHA
tara:strand:- start:290 stop:823 length:534 start_codon:yes stop_codon:yes gene_type:complete